MGWISKESRRRVDINEREKSWGRRLPCPVSRKKSGFEVRETDFKQEWSKSQNKRR